MYNNRMYMKERIRKVMEYAQVTQQVFATRLGISPSSLSSIFTGRTNPSQKQVTAIHHAFPEINMSWLMFGEGEMIITPAIKTNEETPSPPSSENSSEDHYASQSARSLFDPATLGASHASPTPSQQSRRIQPETNLPYRQDAPTLKMQKNFDKICRKVKEIRVFFDDGTYESFVPSSK